MSIKRRAYFLAGAIALTWTTSASAVIMRFTFDTTLRDARVFAVDRRAGASPFIDKSAAAGKLNGRFGFSLEGLFDTDRVKGNSNQSVRVELTQVDSSTFGSIFIPIFLTLTKSSTGQIGFSFGLPSLTEGYGTKEYDIFDDSNISAATQTAFFGRAITSLQKAGSYYLYGENISNLYGTQAEQENLNFFDDSHYYEYTSEYIRRGADVVSGTNSSRFFSGGTFTLTPDMPPAVPEPDVWATMICGLGVVGGVMRRLRRINRLPVARQRLA